MNGIKWNETFFILKSGVWKFWFSKLNIGPNFVGSQSFHFKRNDPLKRFTLKCKSKFYFLFWKLETPQLILQFCCLYESNFEVSPLWTCLTQRQTSNFVSSPRSGIAYLNNQNFFTTVCKSASLPFQYKFDLLLISQLKHSSEISTNEPIWYLLKK